MLRNTRGSVCILCQWAAKSSRIRPDLVSLTQPCLGPQQQRTFTRRSATTRPSRMVLSDRDHIARTRFNDGSNPPRRRVDGPFSGMNRRVANIDPHSRRPRDRSVPFSDNTTEDRYSKDKKDPRNMKALKMQQALPSIGYGYRARLKARLQEIESFEQLDLLPELKEAVKSDALRGLTGIRPTPVQRLAIPPLLGSRDHRRSQNSPIGNKQEFLIAAETGSGKTLAYLLPVINALKQADTKDEMASAYRKRFEEEKARRGDQPISEWINRFEPHPNMARPRGLVLVPTAELVEQVYRVAKTLTHVAKCKVRAISATHDPLKIQRSIFSPTGVDLVVATPHLMSSIAENDPNVLSRVSHLVLDEADSLLDRSFLPITTAIIDRANPSLRQLILCSATIPKWFDTFTARQFPDACRITTPNLHAIPRRVQLGVIDATRDPYRGNKLLACADAVWSIGREAARHEGPNPNEVDMRRIMVFVNERETTQEVASYLKTKGIDAIALHRDASEHRQSEVLGAFMERTKPAGIPLDEAGKAALRAKRTLPNTQVIVATDLASRGLDTLAVRHVVLYDVPHSTIDFIHRLGRAGRMGRRGRGIVLVGKNDRKDVVAEVKESMFMGRALI